ncbi:MAG: MFS transporter [Cuniculiplasma sp.]|jgi:MFS family permease|nr:MFS transporter [Cuniculiplasma sp.]
MDCLHSRITSSNGRGVEQAFFQIGLVPKLVEKIGTFKTIIIGILSFVLSFILLSFKVPEFVSLIALSLFAFGYSLFQTPVIAFVSQISNESTRGANLGITQSAQSIASIIGPLIAGYLFDSISKFIPFQISALMGILSILFIGITIHGYKKIEAL